MIFLQEQPIVVDVLKQPAPTRDISIDVVLGMFQMAGVVLLTAAVGGLIAGLIFIAHPPHARCVSSHTGETEHVRLRI